MLPLDDVIVPDSPQSLAEVVAACHGDGTPLYTLGGQTMLGYGVWPRRPGHGLSLEKLSGVVDYAARDLTITVGAGTPLVELDSLLAEENQRLPVDVPDRDRATVGGLVATNLCGPRRYRFGTMRDYVIGFSAVDGLGATFRGGGRVVKNAAGYNMTRLMTGSLGTLGVLTEVTLMVRPMAETTAMLAADLPSLDLAAKLLAELPASKTLPAAVELLLGDVWSQQSGLEPWPPETTARLIVAFEDADPDVRWMVEQLESQWSKAGVRVMQRVGNEDAESLWKNLATTIPPGAATADNTHCVVQVGVPPGSTVDIAARLKQIDPGVAIQAHAGNGVVRGRLTAEAARLRAMLVDEIRPATEMAGGHAVVLSAPPEAELDVGGVWGPPPSGMSIMRSIKDRFDPKHLLNPGRFVFG